MGHGKCRASVPHESRHFETLVDQRSRSLGLWNPIKMTRETGPIFLRVVFLFSHNITTTIVWANTEKELEERVLQVLMRCRESGITISQKKMQIGNSIHFAGHIISDKGIRRRKIRCNQKISKPKRCQGSPIFLGISNAARVIYPRPSSHYK